MRVLLMIFEVPLKIRSWCQELYSKSFQLPSPALSLPHLPPPPPSLEPDCATKMRGGGGCLELQEGYASVLSRAHQRFPIAQLQSGQLGALLKGAALVLLRYALPRQTAPDLHQPRGSGRGYVEVFFAAL